MTSLPTEINEKCDKTSYSAPEILDEGTPYHKEVDIWSLGVILYQMITK